MFEHLDELAGFEQRIMRAGVEPRGAAAEVNQSRGAVLDVDVVQIGDLEFAAQRRFKGLRDLDDVIVVEVQPRDGKVRLRPDRLLLDGEQGAVGVDLDRGVLVDLSVSALAG